jgi:3-deoxy-manno-octulosonate cytidylyltransferase (CMP-KDO synthetase)
VIVETDDERIRDAVSEFGVECVMTSVEHRSGTDRLAEVASSLPADSIIVNVQGDEPLIAPATIDAAVTALLDDDAADMATTCEPIESLAQLLNGNVVKVVVADDGHAIYFSRSPMPYPRDPALRHGGDPNRAITDEPELISLFRKHTGLYVYRRDYLLRLSQLPPSTLEQIEMLEQLRALEDGARIKVVTAAAKSIGVDTQDDYDAVRSILESDIEIRPATQADVSEIAKVHVEAWQRSFKGIAPEDYLNSMSIAKRVQVFGDRLKNPSYKLLVADDRERGVIGFIDFGTPDFENYGYDARVYSFYLLPEFQRRGVGKKLFERCFDEMTEDGYRSMCLDTLEMSPYRKFYDKHGGRVVAQDSHKLGDREFPTLIYGWETLRP